jgi:hypothetical protein
LEETSEGADFFGAIEGDSIAQVLTAVTEAGRV